MCTIPSTFGCDVESPLGCSSAAENYQSIAVSRIKFMWIYVALPLKTFLSILYTRRRKFEMFWLVGLDVRKPVSWPYHMISRHATQRVSFAGSNVSCADLRCSLGGHTVFSYHGKIGKNTMGFLEIPWVLPWISSGFFWSLLRLLFKPHSHIALYQECCRRAQHRQDHEGGLRRQTYRILMCFSEEKHAEKKHCSVLAPADVIPKSSC